MLFDLARRWWVVALRGVVAVVFGILAFVWPELTLLTLITLFGAFALVDGVLSLIAGLSSIQTNERWWAELIEGLVGIAFGLVVFFWPEVTALALLYLIAGWAVVTGILEIVAAIRLRRVITGEWAMILGGIASILFGVLLAAFPGAGILGLAWLIGLYAVLFGVLLIIVGLRLRGMREAL